jgi:predicted dehydrogenase
VLRWGLLGTARINRLLIPAVRASTRSEVAAVASRDERRAAAYAAEWRIPRATSYERLAADPALDILYIPLPNSLHASWTIRAVEAGRHVLCEKPLALSPGDVDAIAAAASQHGRVVTEGFMYRHTAQTARIVGLLHDGALGAVRRIESVFTFLQNRTPDVRLDPALGGGSLWDVGCYPVSLAQLLAGAPPAAVSGTARIGPTGVDEHFTGRIDYANGVVASFTCGFRADYRTWLRVAGTDGTLVVERPFRPEPVERLRLERHGIAQDVVVRGNAIFADEVADMEDAVLGVRPPRITLAESRQNVETIVRLLEASRA